MSLSTFNRLSLRTALMTTLVIAAGSMQRPVDHLERQSRWLRPLPTRELHRRHAARHRARGWHRGARVARSVDPGRRQQHERRDLRQSERHRESHRVEFLADQRRAARRRGSSRSPCTTCSTTRSAASTAARRRTIPSACSCSSRRRRRSCRPRIAARTVNVLNTQGTASFSGINQKYYWYHDRLAAKGQAGDSTKNNPTWTFTAPSTVNSFRFTVLLSAPWPRGMQAQDTSWAVAYNPAADSLPDVNASPRLEAHRTRLRRLVQHVVRGTRDERRSIRRTARTTTCSSFARTISIAPRRRTSRRTSS